MQARASSIFFFLQTFRHCNIQKIISNFDTTREKCCFYCISYRLIGILFIVLTPALCCGFVLKADVLLACFFEEPYTKVIERNGNMLKDYFTFLSLKNVQQHLLF